MENLSFKEKINYRFLLNESRTYRFWYTRFLICGVDLARIYRVISWIKSFYIWCDEWIREGVAVELLALDALKKENTYSARQLFHEAAGCFHIGEHIYFLDLARKNAAQERARHCYKKAISLYEDSKKPLRIEIPFRKTCIPGYLHRTALPGQPLIIFVNGLDDIKEAEDHFLSNILTANGFNVFAFDGPGQGEMWKHMKMIPDYESVVTTIIDWFEKHRDFDVDIKRIGIYGWNFGGYLAVRSAAFDKRVSCVISNGGPGFLDVRSLKKIDPLWIKDLLHVMGLYSLEEAEILLHRINIKDAPALERPLLIIQGGEDDVIPQPWDQAHYMLNWARGEKELKYYPDGDHLCANYFDEIIPHTIDWLKKHLFR